MREFKPYFISKTERNTNHARDLEKALPAFNVWDFMSDFIRGTK